MAIDTAISQSLIRPSDRADKQQDRNNKQSNQLLPVSNAGLVVLWPLLPQLFATLGLLEQQQFISEEARWQAVAVLDWLAWGAEPSVADRTGVNRLLCGITLNNMLLPQAEELTQQQQQQTDDWLLAVGQQLAGWQKMGLSDMRQLFLQRPGEIDNDAVPPQLMVKPEAYDLLLSDWPWPLTLASLPWLDKPLTIIWPLSGLTG